MYKIGKIDKKLWTAIFTRRSKSIRIISVRRTGKKEAELYGEKKIAKSTDELDRRFDEGEDIHDLIDMTKAKIVRHGKKVRLTLDVAEELVNEIDRIRERIGVDRGALIKIWLHERVQQEKVT